MNEARDLPYTRDPPYTAEETEREVWQTFAQILISVTAQLPARVRRRRGADDLRTVGLEILETLTWSKGSFEPIRTRLLDRVAAALTSASRQNIGICDLRDLVSGDYDGEK